MNTIFSIPLDIFEFGICTYLSYEECFALSMTCTQSQELLLNIKRKYATQCERPFLDLLQQMWADIASRPIKYKTNALAYHTFLDVVRTKFRCVITMNKQIKETLLYHASVYYHELIFEYGLSKIEYDTLESIRMQMKPFFKLLPSHNKYPDFIQCRLCHYMR
jgi:hypothetical protein